MQLGMESGCGNLSNRVFCLHCQTFQFRARRIGQFREWDEDRTGPPGQARRPRLFLACHTSGNSYLKLQYKGWARRWDGISPVSTGRTWTACVSRHDPGEMSAGPGLDIGHSGAAYRLDFLSAADE